MKWFFLLGEITFALLCFADAVLQPQVAWATAPAGALSAGMALLIWSDCRGEWRP